MEKVGDEIDNSNDHVDNNEDKTSMEPSKEENFQLLLKQHEDLANKYEKSKLNEEESGRQHKALESKHQKLVDKLRERIECPVCLEVPQAGPISTCPNGHLVCSKCRSNSCPTCRSRMFEGKSLLAVTVLENIEHKCRNQGCDQLLPLTEVEAHKKVCMNRLLSCPATLCSERIPFCNLIDHVMNDCNNSYAKEDKEIVDLTSKKEFHLQRFLVNTKCKEPYMLDTYMWNGKYFFLVNNKSVDSNDDWTFHVEMLGTEEEASLYRVELVLHKHEDIEAEDQVFYRFKGEPCSVDEEKKEKKRTGLTVSNRIVETKLCKVSEEEECPSFQISLAFKKNL